MGYDDDEDSVSDGEPVELYDFLAGTTHYYITSAEMPVMFAGDTYLPVASSRSGFRASAAADQPELKVQIPVDHALAAVLLRPLPQVLTCQVYRFQIVSGDYIAPWGGPVSNIALEGEWVSVTVPSLLSKLLNDEWPPRAHQRHCGNQLYDEFCQVDPDGDSPDSVPFRHATTVDGAPGGLTFDVGTVGSGWPDGWCNGGKLEHENGEKRRIVRQVGTLITINYPIYGMANTDVVILYAGCGHRIKQDCRDKFNNVHRFGGTPLIPSRNPWRVGLRGIE